MPTAKAGRKRTATKKVTPAQELPDKLYFRIGEAAELIGVKPYVLRYWETEFSILKPSKSGSQHRLYRKRDIDTLKQIKQLLYNDRLTIEGARKRLKELQKTDRRQGELPLAEANFRAVLRRVRRELESIHRLLST